MAGAALMTLWQSLLAQLQIAKLDLGSVNGQSVYWLIVSRSRRHGLRREQPRIIFQFDNDRVDVLANFDGETRLSFPKIELTTEIDALLRQLETREID